jgi:glutathione-regulated potassium-efflux system protein KefB
VCARNRRHELQLREMGVEFVIRDTLMSSLTLSTELLQRLGLTEEQAKGAVDMFRKHDAATLARQAAVYKDEQAFRQTSIEAADELKELFTEDAVSREARTSL